MVLFNFPEDSQPEKLSNLGKTFKTQLLLKSFACKSFIIQPHLCSSKCHIAMCLEPEPKGSNYYFKQADEIFQKK